MLKYVRVSSAIGRPVLPSPARLDNTVLFAAFKFAYKLLTGTCVCHCFAPDLFCPFKYENTQKTKKKLLPRQSQQTARFPVEHDFPPHTPHPLLLFFFSLFRNIPCSSGTSQVKKSHGHFAPRVEASDALSCTATSNHSLVWFYPLPAQEHPSLLQLTLTCSNVAIAVGPLVCGALKPELIHCNCGYAG